MRTRLQEIREGFADSVVATLAGEPAGDLDRVKEVIVDSFEPMLDAIENSRRAVSSSFKRIREIAFPMYVRSDGPFSLGANIMTASDRHELDALLTKTEEALLDVIAHHLALNARHGRPAPESKTIAIALDGLGMTLSQARGAIDKLKKERSEG